MTSFKDTLKALDIRGVAFVNLAGYENASGEIQDALINVGMSYENALNKDKTFLEELPDAVVADLAREINVSVEIMEEARVAMLESVERSLSKEDTVRAKAQKEAFEHQNAGIMVHVNSGEVFVKGFIIRKTVRSEGDYKEDTRKPLTRAKDKFRTMMTSRQMRRYKLDNIKKISSKGDTLVIS